MMTNAMVRFGKSVRGLTKLGVACAVTWVSAISVFANDAPQLIVRWHGDYYQHKWIAGVPGGTPPNLTENRWLRGGPSAGAVQFALLDADNDAELDDSRVSLPFSLDEKLNPRGFHDEPDGVYYHEDMPSAQFYGGLSATYLNLHTDRIQQAFIENDGAGGALDDVGYAPSPYVEGGAQYDEEFSEWVESARHPDGRYRKSHLGPQEDFAINIYRPDLPHPLDPEDDPTDNLTTFHAAFIWKKADFLAGGDQSRVEVNDKSSFSFESTRWWANVGEARWIVQDGDGQLYISQFSSSGAMDAWGHTNELSDPLGSLWTLYNPVGDLIDFDQDSIDNVWLDPVVEGLFQDVLAFGVYVENDVAANDFTKFTLDEIRFEATVVSASFAADFDDDGDVDGDDFLVWQASFDVNNQGDADGDGDTDGDDFLVWQSEFGSGPGAGSNGSVPEPGSAFLAIVAILILVWFFKGRLRVSHRAC